MDALLNHIHDSELCIFSRCMYHYPYTCCISTVPKKTNKNPLMTSGMPSNFYHRRARERFLSTLSLLLPETIIAPADCDDVPKCKEFVDWVSISPAAQSITSSATPDDHRMHHSLRAIGHTIVIHALVIHTPGLARAWMASLKMGEKQEQLKKNERSRRIGGLRSISGWQILKALRRSFKEVESSLERPGGTSDDLRGEDEDVGTHRVPY